MTKKVYMKPVMNVVKVQQQHIICESNYGMKQNLDNNTVTSAWSRGGDRFEDDED